MIHIPKALEGQGFKNCTRCHLSDGRNHPPIPGTSSCPMSDVRLVVVSAYPGAEEVKAGQSLSPSQRTMNAGRILQAYLHRASVKLGWPEHVLYGLTYRTNAMKCPPRGKKADKLVHPRNICRAWLMAEIAEVGDKVPILLAGTEAVQSLLPGVGLYEGRGFVHWYGTHPVVCTINPIQVERAARKDTNDKGNLVALPPVVGSDPWLFQKDIDILVNLLGGAA